MNKFGKQALVLAACALALAAGAMAASGSPTGESLVSLSYLNETYIPQVVEEGSVQAEERLDAVYFNALEELRLLAEQQPGETRTLYSAAYTRQTLSLADRLVLPSGSGLLLEQGSATVSHEGMVVDVTAGQALSAGDRLTTGHRYLVAENTQATFTIDSDAAKVAVEGGYTLARSGVSATPFTDISIHDWFHDAVQTVYFHNLFAGMGDGSLFVPEERMSRAMMMTVLFHLAGDPEEERAAAQATFPDVPEGEWYTSYVSWAAEKNVSAGYGDGTFQPNKYMTRQEVVQFLYNFARSYLGLELTGQADLSGFDDADQVDVWGMSAMSWAVDAGLLTALRPQDLASRAEVAALLANFVEKFL